MKKRKWTQKEVIDWMQKHDTCIYCNPNDTNIFVRKVFGIGWVLNWGNPMAYVSTVGFIAFLLFLMKL